MIIWKFSAFLPLFRPLIPVSCRSLKIATERLLRQENFTSRFVSESTKKRISLHLSSLPPGLPPPRLSALISCPSVSCVPISSFQVSRIPASHLSARPVSYHSVSRVRPPPDFRSPGNPSQSRFPLRPSITLKSRRVLSHPAAFYSQLIRKSGAVTQASSEAVASSSAASSFSSSSSRTRIDRLMRLLS